MPAAPDLLNPPERRCGFERLRRKKAEAKALAKRIDGHVASSRRASPSSTATSTRARLDRPGGGALFGSAAIACDSGKFQGYRHGAAGLGRAMRKTRARGGLPFSQRAA